MKKRSLFMTLVLLTLVFALVFTLAACKDGDDNGGDGGDGGDNGGDVGGDVILTDEQYKLEIVGYLSDGSVLEVSKKQIKDLFAEEGKGVEMGVFDPVKFNDPTSDLEGQKIQVKGVYLDDILAKYSTEGKTTSDFVTIHAYEYNGNYNMLYTKNIFDPEINKITDEGNPFYEDLKDGSRILIAFEYDGEVLDGSNKKSGYMRAVINGQAQNTWLKNIKKFVFSDEIAEQPDPKVVKFVDFLLEDDDLLGSFTRRDRDGNNVTYTGLSLEKLRKRGVFVPDAEDLLYLSAWDYNAANEVWNQYTGWLIYSIFKEGFLLTGSSAGGNFEGAPAFDSPDIPDGSGMKVKSVVALSVGQYAMVSLDMLFGRYCEEGNDWISVDAILDEIIPDSNIEGVLKKDLTGKNVEITPKTGAKVTVSGEAFAAAKIFKVDGGYVLRVEGQADIAFKEFKFV